MGGYGWGDVQEQELIDAVHTCLDSGINYFDTADTYGLGQSEKTLAKALENHRKDVVIQTKFGVRRKDGKSFYDNSPEYIREACENSLRRLSTDYIDVYVIHYRDNVTPMDKVVEAMQQLKEEGKIRYFGLSNIHCEGVSEMANWGGQFCNVQNEYSLAKRDFEHDLSEVCQRLDVSPLTWGSLGQGILTGKYTRDSVFAENDRRSRDIYTNFHGKKLIKNLRIVEEMRPIAERHGVSVSSVAIRFILDHIKDSVVLFGAKRPAQVMSNMEASGWHLAPDELRLLDEVSR